MFNQSAMHPMHDSMGRLYKFVRENKKITGQTELATAMGETPQVINNWEGRGISQRGANLAQKKFGCDANWLLGKSETVFHIDRDQAATRVVTDNGVVDLRRKLELDEILRNLSGYLSQMDAGTRRRSGVLLADLANAPEDHANVAAAMTAMMASGNLTQMVEGRPKSTSSDAG
jgi:hypothetical protein